MSRAKLFLTTRGLDVLVVVLALAAAVGTALREDAYRPDGAKLVLEIVAIALMVLALTLRHRAPFAAPATTWLVGAGLSFLDGRLIVGQAAMSIAGMIAAVLLGNLPGRRQARAGLAVVAASAAMIAYNDPAHSVGDQVFIPVLFSIGWLVGFVLHERAEETQAAEERATQAERDREAAARIAVAEERGRIARELHDVVAHALSVMVLQVGALRHRMPEDSRDRKALENVEQAGRTALAEMRRLLDAMRAEGDEAERAPHPGLGDLDALVSEVRAAGLDVRLQIHGEPLELPPGLDLSAYRILQEGLTNTLKHANAQHADLEVRYAPGDLILQVRDDGRGATAPDGRGHGLVGIRERVRIYGGEMSAEATGEGGFVLRARLPMDGGR